MKINVGIIGGGGLVGSALKNYLEKSYNARLIKSALLYSAVADLASALKGYDIIINLAGYPIAGRWNARVKELIYNSRISTTKNLVEAIGTLDTRPVQLINASAVGIYADDETCDEESGNYAVNFLAKVVVDWEKEAANVEKSGVNLTVLRIGVVLSRAGGAYSILRKIFRMGAGGKIGNGKQGFSYVLIDDLVQIFDFVIKNRIYGIVNAVLPNPTDNKTFTRELALALRRPAVFTIPAVFLKFLLREGSSTLLEGQKVIPKVLTSKGFTFVGNNLAACLNILEK